MKPSLDQSAILQAASEIIGEPFAETKLAAEGIDNIVLLVTTESKKKYAIKTGENVSTDAYVLRMLAGKNFKVPRLFGETTIPKGGASFPLIIMSFYGSPLLKEAPDQSLYIESVLKELQHIHKMPSPKRAGHALDVEKGDDSSWKDFLTGRLSGKDADFDWEKVCGHPLVSRELITKCLDWAMQNVAGLPDTLPMRLLHTDINSTNIFIKNGEVEGIIDWSDAKFGDPVFDLARLHMHIKGWLDQKCLEAYTKYAELSEEEWQREKTYHVINLLEYLNWYVLYGLDERLPILTKQLEKISYA